MDNFCSLGKNNLGSECLAGTNKNRKKCEFYKKASQFDDCRFYRFDFMCDCLKAQMCECSVSLNNGNGNGNGTKIIDEREQEEAQRLLFYDQG